MVPLAANVAIKQEFSDEKDVVSPAEHYIFIKVKTEPTDADN